MVVTGGEQEQEGIINAKTLVPGKKGIPITTPHRPN